jgi:CDP-diacylglycerol--glycerol-3-phosphate 3-phosphatidyltransferase
VSLFAPDPPDGLLVLVVVIGTCLASMVVYALLGRKRDADATGKGAQLFLGFGDFLLHWFMWTMAPLVWISLRLGLTPDFYNYAGLALGLLSGIFIGRGQLALGGWAIALGGVADILDGRLARLLGVASSYGDFIDSTFDRYVESFAFLGFVVFLRGDLYGPFLATAAMAGSLLVSYTRARGEVLGVNCVGGLMQRGERLVITCLVCLLDPVLTARAGWRPGALSLWMLGFMALTTFVTAVHRTIWISLRLRKGTP